MIKRVVKKIGIAILLIGLLVQPFSYSYTPSLQQVEAFGFEDLVRLGTAGSAQCAANILAGKLTSFLSNALGGLVSGLTSVPVSDSGVKANQQTQIIKEGCLDGIAYIAAKTILGELNKKSLSWIQGGFEFGNKGFSVDLDSRLRAKVDQAFLHYLTNPESFEKVCHSYRDDLAITLLQTNPTSTLKDVAEETLTKGIAEAGGGCELEETAGSVEDAEAFLNGDFSKGGWDSWFALMGDSGSNPYIAYLSGQSTIDKEAAERQQLELEKLSWGSGFLGEERCVIREGDKIQYQEPEGNGLCPDGALTITVTPGSTVANIIDTVTTGDIRSLELADELNEVIAGATQLLVGKLMDTVFGGEGNDNLPTDKPGGLYGTESDDIAILGNPNDPDSGYKGGDPGNFIPDTNYYAGKTPIDWLGNDFPWIPIVVEERNYVKISFTGEKYEWELNEQYIPLGDAPICTKDEHKGSVKWVLASQQIDPVFPGGIWMKFKCDPDNKEWDHTGHWVPNEWGAKGGPPPSDCQHARKMNSDEDRYMCFFDAWRFPITANADYVYQEEMFSEEVNGETVTDTIARQSACEDLDDVGDHYFVLNEHSTWRIRECVERKAPEGPLVQWKDEQMIENLAKQIRYSIPTVQANLKPQLDALVRDYIIFRASRDTGLPVFRECIGNVSRPECFVDVGKPNAGEGGVVYPDDPTTFNPIDNSSGSGNTSSPQDPTLPPPDSGSGPIKETVPNDPNDPS